MEKRKRRVLPPIVDALFVECRRQRLTQVAWGRKANVNRKTIYSINRNGKNAGLTTLTKLGKGLGLELVWKPDA